MHIEILEEAQEDLETKHDPAGNLQPPKHH